MGPKIKRDKIWKENKVKYKRKKKLLSIRLTNESILEFVETMKWINQMKKKEKKPGRTLFSCDRCCFWKIYRKNKTEIRQLLHL